MKRIAAAKASTGATLAFLTMRLPWLFDAHIAPLTDNLFNYDVTPDGKPKYRAVSKPEPPDIPVGPRQVVHDSRADVLFLVPV